MRQRLRRVGTASAAVSAGALVLVLAAPASHAAAAEVCKEGVDPETTIENWKCNLGNLREALTPETPVPEPTPEPEPTPTPTPEPTRSKAAEAGSGGQSAAAKKPASKPAKTPAQKPSRPAAAAPAPSGAGAPAPPSTMTGPGDLRTFSVDAPSTAPELPSGVLPTPEIAADPNAYRQPMADTVAMQQTRLISPAAAAPQPDNGHLLLVAAAAGAAGAVGALNISIAGRTLRARRASR